MREIEVNGSLLSIRDNLWQFLDESGSNSKGQWYWIDATSIDQSNIGERNHQVGLMRDIYLGVRPRDYHSLLSSDAHLQATAVTIWLGQSTRTSDMAMECIDRLQRRDKLRKNRKPWSQNQRRAVIDLCGMAYWRRVWIVQEIMLARNINVRSGRKVMEWACFERMVTRFRETQTMVHPSHAKAVLANGAVRIIDCKMTWNTLGFAEKASALDYLLQKYRNMESSDAVDKVYGFLGLLEFLAPGDRKFHIEIDYSMSVEEVFAKVNSQLQTALKLTSTEERLNLIDTLRKALRLPRSDLTVLTAKNKILPQVKFDLSRHGAREAAKQKTYDRLQQQMGLDEMEL